MSNINNNLLGKDSKKMEAIYTMAQKHTEDMENMDDIKNNQANQNNINNMDMNCPTDQSLAMAYVPMQKWIDTYDPETGFNRGTIFPGLDKPFLGEEAIPNE